MNPVIAVPLYRLRMRYRHARRDAQWPARRWVVTIAFVLTAVVVAVGVYRDVPRTRAGQWHAGVQLALRELAGVPVVAARSGRDDYERSAFGASWTDDASVTGGGNGCDTRNDVLTRDLGDVRIGPVTSCPRAVLAGELRSPYTGKTVVFRRDRSATAVQIDHIVPLAFAWDMGAFGWSTRRRVDLANDPANLVAVDAASNQEKSDSEPARWLPPNRGFHCQYAIEFVVVSRAYGLAVDAASRSVLAGILNRC
ncbi:HNH endonuclease family protein [Gordonia sputi]